MITATQRPPGFVLRDHVFRVPLRHHDPDSPEIEIFAREVVAPGTEGLDLPWLVYLQGGPGGKSPRMPFPAWVRQATQEFRVLLLDQRGTGRSTPATRQTLATLDSEHEQAEYLAEFRADAIVRDAELIRRELMGDRPWTVLGQSFGGFCALTYLSFAPEGLREVLITGGVPPLSEGPDEVYRACYPEVLAHNDAYYARYPEDVDTARRVRDHLADQWVLLPTGAVLTPECFQTLGDMLGQASRFDGLHALLEEAFVDGRRGPELSDTFLRGVDGALSFAGSPLYAVLHESIYCQHEASQWSAHRVRSEFPQFDGSGQLVVFTGEMIYPWMFEQDPALGPLRGAAELLAKKADWPALYDLDRLERNDVPVAAAVFHDDMFVNRTLSLRSAERVRGMRTWVTNEFAHDGLRADAAVLERVLGMARGQL
ncbi:alpha/beta fold hydrolase [Allosaccharopolyspora coralli]|uniref:Alpha/beta fold hydrolase n=1 Tax=Allosaccharopolyspora coralli TaxID=2665642 RepID=A0A5Q3Q7Y1_9PSEU|nr:alpha/beta fold hydrolase [Allosaccharopolyspora coralli]QGK69546.1 alpha/beta fold hydrolase [Allosaccharopolyspora coralli]